MSSAIPYRLTAVQAAKQIRAGTLTAEEYARSILSRIEERDGTVKAWAYLNPELVIAQAKELDQVPLENRGPLHGVSVAVKDVIYTKDMPTEHNSVIYANSVAGVDAGSIMILRKAGALIVGKTTTPEFAAVTDGPKTCNPHDPKRTPGGSSTGSAAAVADFQAAIGLGTQTAGSTIRPGSFNGIYAFKPTWNSITREGQKIYSLILDTLGLYTRSVEDLELLADVFALQDDEPPFQQTGGQFELRAAKIGLMKTMNWSDNVQPATVAAMETAVKLLKAHGAEVEEVELPDDLRELPYWHSVVLAAEGRSAFLPEYALSKDKLHSMLVGHVENASKRTHAEHLRAFDSIAAARPRVDALLSKYAAVLTPSVPGEAPVGTESTGSPAFNLIWTALHVPVVNVPGFQGENGMPVGVSFVAPRYEDRKLLAVCKAAGKIFEEEGGWKSQL
ncbi:hypothetical protein N0V93_008501 [Gnomoniopsis smithogilvyi]|uniref:Amidase domain-containing protein n=1 Tax=Gnomoniopsis smithogilvyi TaxID=1191159 RepID=A0A9W8YN46_9PEZI|nr:hypothetical protein N0V93_008501 [Gnomoniopsis smithogilvyi]